MKYFKNKLRLLIITIIFCTTGITTPLHVGATSNNGIGQSPAHSTGNQIHNIINSPQNANSNPVNNCSTFASNLWNKVSSHKLDAGTPNTPTNLKNSIVNQGYVYGRALRYDYLVYYAQGTGLAKPSTVFK